MGESPGRPRGNANGSGPSGSLAADPRHLGIKAIGDRMSIGRAECVEMRHPALRSDAEGLRGVMKAAQQPGGK